MAGPSTISTRVCDFAQLYSQSQYQKMRNAPNPYSLAVTECTGAAQITIRGIILDANPFITAYASLTNKYHTGWYIQNVRGLGPCGRPCLWRMMESMLQRGPCPCVFGMLAAKKSSARCQTAETALAHASCVSARADVVALSACAALQGDWCLASAVCSNPNPDQCRMPCAQSNAAYEQQQIAFLKNALATSRATYNFVSAH